MRKRLTALVLVVFLSTSVLFAEMFSLQIGPNIGYGMNLEEIQKEHTWQDYLAIENFSIAPEVRLNLWFLQVDVLSNLSFGSDFFRADTQATAAVQFKLGDTFRLGVGGGISTPIVSSSGAWKINGEDFNNFDEAIANSRMLYKVFLGVDFPAMELAFNWAIPANGSFNEGDFMPSINDSTFSIGFLFNLLHF